jgi:hypothetical protein
MRPISSVATFSTILVLLSAAAWADDNLNCDAYAAKAVEQQQENQTLGCGFAGPAWSTDGQGHRNWCWLPQVQMVDLVKEDNARAGALNACRQQATACGQYAALAVEQNQMAKGCNFSGAAWHNDANRHRTWCMTATAAAVETETIARNAAIAGCDAQLANIDLQNKLQRMQQILQMMSNISKQIHDSQMNTIRKIGG